MLIYDSHGILETHFLLTEDCILEPDDEWTASGKDWTEISKYENLYRIRIRDIPGYQQFYFRRKIK